MFPGTLPRTEQNLPQDVNKRMIKLAEIDNIETSPKDFIWEVGIPRRKITSLNTPDADATEQLIK